MEDCPDRVVPHLFLQNIMTITIYNTVGLPVSTSRTLRGTLTHKAYVHHVRIDPAGDDGARLTMTWCDGCHAVVDFASITVCVAFCAKRCKTRGWPFAVIGRSHWTTSSGRIELQITPAQAATCSHSGQCDSDVMALSRVPSIAQQLARIKPDILTSELRDYGAWDDTELADHDQNLQRILWIATCDMDEGNV